MSLLGPPLEAFLAVVKQQTVHGAAKELGLTQTGVTQRIRALEGGLSATLFTRSRRGMRLTHEGEALLRYCQAARELEGEALAKIQAAGRRAEVRVQLTGPTSIFVSRVIPQCAPVLALFPELCLTFEIVDLLNRTEDLRTGKAQLAVVPPEQVAREMDSKLLRPESYLLVAAADWKKRPLKDILARERIIDFDPTDHTTHQYLKKHGLLNQARAERHFVNNNESLVMLLERGTGYGVLTADIAQPYLERGRLVALNGGAAYQRRLALAWYPRTQMPAYFHSLVKAIR